LAIFHLSVKTVSRSAGQSATASSAYRSGEKIRCNREGITHDYTRKSGIEGKGIFTPEDAPSWARNREQLWNAAEAAETRKNSTVAREFEVAFPAELNKRERQELIRNFAKAIVIRHQCVVDVAMHEPSREGDERNYHAHVLLTTRRIDHTGFTEKTRELDERKSGEVVHWREQWAVHCNQSLERAGYDERVDHRSLEAQGIDREPTVHLGVEATALERRKTQSKMGNLNREAEARNAAKLERPLNLDQEILATEKILAELKYTQFSEKLDQRLDFEKRMELMDAKIDAKLSNYISNSDKRNDQKSTEKDKPDKDINEMSR
jgi:ATP-dependent exoDNAse (exonuclease V) alpha subunit